MDIDRAVRDCYRHKSLMLENRSDNFIDKCKKTIVDYFNDRVADNDDEKISVDEIFIVWFCRSQTNYKALFSTMIPDGRYYELTLVETECKIYLDVYKAWDSTEISTYWGK